MNFLSGIKNTIAVVRSRYTKGIRNSYTEDCVRVISYRAGPVTISKLRKNWQQHASQISPYPGKYSGKGIVMCAGGTKYFTCAWVNITMLRSLGCQLPIEVWYNGSELTADVIEQLKPLNVTCKNSIDYGGAEIENFALKAFAILNSSFKEVMFLDADNNCVSDPSYLFENDEYKKCGTIFWPDFWTTEKENSIWKIIGSSDVDSMEQESGQILINKEKCWKELNLCLYFNINRKSYYKMLLGDKDTFKFAWLALGSPYYMIPTPVGHCGYRDPKNGYFRAVSMIQHDQHGEILFIHRNILKWDITKENEKAWKEIIRYKPGTKNKKAIVQYADGLFYQSIAGDIDVIPFDSLFGNYEDKCLEILKGLRASGFYTNFLLHSYFSYFRPGYSLENKG